MKLPRDPASLQAMRYIQMFDEALKKRGVQVLIGIEEEFVADKVSKKDREDVAKYIYQAFNDAPRHIRKELSGIYNDNLYANQNSVRSGSVNRFYDEVPNRQYEITTTRSMPLKAAHRIAGLRHWIGKYENNSNLPIWSRYLNKPLKNIEFDGQIPYGPQNGMHINISLNAIQHGSKTSYLSLMSPPKGMPVVSPVIEHLEQKLWELNGTDLALLLSSPSDVDRLNSSSQNSTLMSGTVHKPKVDCSGDKYLEYRMPAADSNPYFAVLIAMSAAYSMLKDLPPKNPNDSLLTNEEMQDFSRKNKKSEFASQQEYTYPDLPKSIYEAEERFKKTALS
jgi:glutamine synthetase